MHKTSIFHTEGGETFVAKVVDFEDFWEIILDVKGKEEILFINKKDGKITHTTGEK